MKKLALLSVFLALPLAAQTPTTLLAGLIDQSQLAANFVDFGAGIHSSQSFTGTSRLCHSVATGSYLCAGTKFQNGTTANTVEYKQVIFAQDGWIASVNGNAGAATGADGGIGGAYRVGGAVTYNVSRLPLLKSHPGWHLGAELSWDKLDVNELVQATPTKTALKTFASRGDYGFFLRYAWN